MATSKLDILIDIQSRLKGLEDAQRGLAQTRASAEGLGGSLRNIANFAIGNLASQAFMQAAAGMKQAAQSGINFNATLEQQTIAFKTLLGSLAPAQRRIQELTKFAAETPFEFPEIVEANKQLQVLTGGALATAEGMRLVGDAAATTGRPISEVSMWMGRLYAGLQSGTPIGEATLRLLEMGLVTADTKRELEQLQASGIGGPEAWAVAERNFRRFSGAMKDQAQTFNGLLSTARDNANIMAGIASEPIFEAIKKGLGAAANDSGPWLEFGKKVRGYLDAAFAAFQDGTFGEFLALSLAAGAEKGAQLMGKVLDSTLFNSSFWARLTSGWVTFSVRVMELLLKAFETPIAYATAGFAFLMARTVAAFEKLGAVVKAVFSSVMSGDLKGLPDAVRAAVNAGPELIKWENTLAAAQAEAAKETKEATDRWRERLSVTKEILGTNSELSKAMDAEGSALSKLTALVEKYMAARAKLDAQKGAGGGAGNNPGVATGQTPTDIAAFLRADKQRLEELKAAQGMVQGSWLLTDAEKFRAQRKGYADQLELLDGIVSKLEQRAKLEQDPATKKELLKEADSFRAEGTRTRGEAANMGPDPQSLLEQTFAKYTEFKNSLGTFASDLGSLVIAPFQGMAQSLTGAIQGLIMRTMTWGQAWRSILSGIVASTIQAFAQMVSNFVMRMVLQFTIGKALQAAAIAAALPMAAAATAMWSTPAFLASVATLGGAPVVGGVALTAGMASALASSLAFTAGGGFAEGGYTGNGGKYQPAGIVHRGEFVFSQADVARIGLPQIQAFRSGAAPSFSPASGGGAPARGGMGAGQLIVVDSRREASRIAENSATEAFIVDVVKRNRGYLIA